MIPATASFSIPQKSQVVREGGRRARENVKVNEPPLYIRYAYKIKKLSLKSTAYQVLKFQIKLDITAIIWYNTCMIKNKKAGI